MLRIAIDDWTNLQLKLYSSVWYLRLLTGSAGRSYEEGAQCQTIDLARHAIARFVELWDVGGRRWFCDASVDAGKSQALSEWQGRKQSLKKCELLEEAVVGLEMWSNPNCKDGQSKLWWSFCHINHPYSDSRTSNCQLGISVRYFSLATAAVVKALTSGTISTYFTFQEIKLCLQLIQSGMKCIYANHEKTTPNCPTKA